MTGASDPNRAKRLWGTSLLVAAGIITVFALIGAFFTGVPAADLTSVLLGLAVMAGIPAAIGAWLLKQAGPAPAMPAPLAPGEPAPMSVVRIIFAVFGILVMVFAGGCGLVFLPAVFQGGPYIGWEVVAIFSVPPFLAGLFIWWAAVKLGRAPKSPPP